MSDDNYDDGLVHGHLWATEPARPHADRDRATVIRIAEDQYDDGLVHGHAWAAQSS